MKYRELEDTKFEVEFETDSERENFIKFFNDITTVSSGQVEEMGISRQLLRYWTNQGYVRTIPHGKQKRYVLADIMKMKG